MCLHGHLDKDPSEQKSDLPYSLLYPAPVEIYGTQYVLSKYPGEERNLIHCYIL